VERFFTADWYSARPASNRKPATYRCPFCRGLLPALSEHMLVFPDGDPARRRHAHTACVVKARKAGRLPMREDTRARSPGLVARLLRRARRATGDDSGGPRRS
jgi:hypothetical protein